MQISFGSSASVHPRACGEQPYQFGHYSSRSGSSPRLRGTVLTTWGETSVDRFIPAPAGNRVVCANVDAMRAVHPRACGEQTSRLTKASRSTGSSPRLRGTGGTPALVVRVDRFIPAPAGNSHCGSAGETARSVHPRACGEQPVSETMVESSVGSSPRLRGTGQGGLLEGLARRFIPAPAGNSARLAESLRGSSVHPRACGEQFNAFKGWVTDAGSSPRLRGTDPS